MKNIISSIKYFAIFAILFSFAACNDKNDVELDDPTMDFIQTKSVTFDGIAAGQEKVISFVSPGNWTAEIHQTGSWLRANTLHGKAGQVEIVLSAKSDNMTVSSRQATIQIYVDGYQAYSIKAEQKGVNSGDITIEGDIDDGVMNLESDSKGLNFTGTIYVESDKKWELEVDASSRGILSFERDSEPLNGEKKKIRLNVTADYSKFPSTSFNGKFYIKVNENTAVPVVVNAQPLVEVFASATPLLGETERTSYELVDTIQRNSFQTTFYVSSNVRWSINEKPSWISTSADWGTAKEVPSNIKSDGTIDKKRHAVVLKVNPDELPVNGKTCIINIVDNRNQVVKTLNLVFKGAGGDYVDYSLAFPAEDVDGNPWAFEAKSATIEEEGPYSRRRISMDFNMTTARDYSSIADAPFHLIMVEGSNGIPKKKEVHWATLLMGDPAERSTTSTGFYVKQLYIKANERGDADDVNKLTDPSQIRYAFAYIVPREITFDDLWDGEQLKSTYAENLTLVSQKNDPSANYTFSFEGYAEGSTITISRDGESKTFNVTPGSYKKCDIFVESQKEDGEWQSVGEGIVQITYTNDENDNPLTVTCAFSKNEEKYNPFTKKYSGAPRHMRIRVSAFIDDTFGSKDIYTIYADQDLIPYNK